MAQYFFWSKTPDVVGIFSSSSFLVLWQTHTHNSRAGGEGPWMEKFGLLPPPPLSYSFASRDMWAEEGEEEGRPTFSPPPPFRQNMAAGPGSNFREVAFPPSGVFFFFSRS